MDKHDLIYITKMPKDQMRALKALREAVKIIEPGIKSSAALETAMVIWDLFQKDGFTYFGITNDVRITKQVQEALEVGDIETKLNLNPEEYAASLKPTPEEVFAEAPAPLPSPPKVAVPVATPTAKERQAKTGLSLLSWADGNPISACAFAASLGRTTGDIKFFEGVIVQIIEAFPWIMESLKTQGIIE